ncbi:MAG: hypothetical protein ACMG57_00455 [Candidatus Dojkabacteria bacterium]
MIKVCPAILTDKKSVFESQMKTYSALFDTIDIDVNVKVDNFKGKVTVPVEIFIPILEKYPKTEFNIHLMTEFPLEEIKKTVNSTIFKKLRFIIHQESRFDKQIFSFLGRSKIAATLEVGSDLESINFYKKFSEVQLMTVDVGYQGAKFEEKILKKANKLRDMGFDGIISIDGGVNLNTAEIIKKYPIKRLSVGSYFSKSNDIETDLKELNDALGNKVSLNLTL